MTNDKDPDFMEKLNFWSTAVKRDDWKQEVEKQAETLSSAQPYRFDEGKTDWNLVPWESVEQIAKVLQFGAKKYNSDNWRSGEGFDYTRVLNSLMRHIVAFQKGEDQDPESGLSHLAHAGCNVLFLLYYQEYQNRYKNDDRFKR